MATRLKLYIPDPSTSGRANCKPPVFTCFGAGGFNEDDGPPPETRVQREHRRGRQLQLLRQLCPCEDDLRLLLRWADEDESYRSLARLWRCVRRTARTRIERKLDRIRGRWLRHLAETTHTEFLRAGEVAVCPWLIELLGCPHTHDTAAEAVYPGIGSVETTEEFVCEHQALLFGGPSNAHLALWYNGQRDLTHVAVFVHRRHAVAVAQRIAPAQGRAA